jgi:hypothetical protein
MRQPTVIALVLAFALAGCGSSKTNSGGGPKTIAVGWTRHHVDDGGFSIEVPAGWRAAEKLDRKSLDEFFKKNPDVAPLERALTGGLVKIIAVDPDVSAGFSTNVNVLVHNIGTTMSLTKYARENKKVVQRLTGTAPDVELTRLPAGSCVQVSYEHAFNFPSGRKKLALLQYAFLRGSSEYVITYTTLPSLSERYRTTFDRSARSFLFD